MTSSIGPWSSVTAIADAVRDGTVTASEIADAAIERARKAQSELNCFAEIDASGARATAAVIDRRREAGEVLGALAGVPVAIKDCTPVAGLGNRFGSHAFANHIASSDAIIVERFKNADAVILGKTTLSEFASSSFCDSPLTGVTRNPWNPARTPGGSSGGSAVAVATGCVAVAQGTDMGGSVRIPASCTGLVGVKPAAGRIPLDDQPSFVDDIQHHGLLTRTVADLAAALPPICGAATADPRTFIPQLPALETIVGLSGLKIAVSDDLGFFFVEPEVKERLEQAAACLKAAGAVVERPALNWDRSIADGWVRHWHVYLASFFGEALDSIGSLADPRLVEAVAKGRTHNAVSIKQLDLLRRRQWEILANLFRDYAALLTPTMTRPAVGVEEDDARYHVVSSDGKKRGLDMTSIFNWVPWCPALSVPAGLSADEMPIGLHVAGPPQREDIVLRVAAAIEKSFPYRWPPEWAP
jgi:Asp-tRNA(Asn)/Glu-tRNA(Gln) amidotransferase A subunit family amidase